MTSALTLVSLPIFPLHTVLFPGGALPLRVFEPRYRMMVRGCREQGAPFGVVTLLSGSEVQRSHAPEERFYPLGTLAHIDMVATLSSGWELIHCAGQDRFRITTARQLANGLWVADVQLLPSDITTPIPADLQHAAAALRHVLHKLLQPHSGSGHGTTVCRLRLGGQPLVRVIAADRAIPAANAGAGQPLAAPGADRRCP